MISRIWSKLGIIAFWLSWPALYIYLKGSQRTRLLLIADDQILVTRSWLSDGRWSLPGGGLHRHERPVDGVLREVFEETGLRLTQSKCRYHGESELQQHGLSCHYHFFIAHASQPLSPLQAGRPEITQVAWVPAAAFNSSNAQPDVMRAIDTMRSVFAG